MQLASLSTHGETQSIPHSTPPNFERCNIPTQVPPTEQEGRARLCARPVCFLHCLLPHTALRSLHSLVCPALCCAPTDAAAAAIELSLDVDLARLGLLHCDNEGCQRASVHVGRSKQVLCSPSLLFAVPSTRQLSGTMT